MNETLRRRLLVLRERDESKREELLARGELWEGYHVEMQAVHHANARVLEEILNEHGWPALEDIGSDGSEAAWVVALHAIGEPAFQRHCLELSERAVREGHADASHRAALVDRIRYNERLPQIFGTIFDWDESGELNPWPIQDAEGVEERRRSVGLPPLAESAQEVRDLSAREGRRAPKPYAERQAQIRAWSRRVGWLAE